jgi:hypothetical protein
MRSGGADFGVLLGLPSRIKGVGVKENKKVKARQELKSPQFAKGVNNGAPSESTS